MKTIRKGNDIVVRWRIFRYGQKYDIALYRESISLVLSNMGEKKEITDYSIVDVNTIVFKYRAKDQGLGIYRLLLIDKSRNSTRIIEECNAFRLVNTSDAANNNDTLESAITITLTSELTAPADGLSAYEVALQNGFVGTEEEWLQSLVPDTTDIELAEAQRQAKELERIEAENTRQSAELERQNASAEAVSSANEAASNANEAAITAQQKSEEANTAASAANAAASNANTAAEKFNSAIVQETGNSQDKVMSQKAVTDALEGKQDTISDLETIREGAGKGSTALQKESDPVYLADRPSLLLEINGKANLQHQHTVADITDFPELYYDATAFLTSGTYPSDRYEELLEAVKAKKTVYATIDEAGYVSYIFFVSSANSDGSSSRVLLTTIFADGGNLYINTFVLQQSGMTRLQENITGKANKAGYFFAGVATPKTNPGTPDAKLFYIANGKGTYEKFGGINVTEDDVVVLYWDSSWHKVSTGIASQEKLSELNDEIVKIYNSDILISGGYIDATSGDVVSSPYTRYTPFIEVRNANLIQVDIFGSTSSLNFGSAWYDEQHNLVSTISKPKVSGKLILEVPENACYFRTTVGLNVDWELEIYRIKKTLSSLIDDLKYSFRVVTATPYPNLQMSSYGAITNAGNNYVIISFPVRKGALYTLNLWGGNLIRYAFSFDDVPAINKVAYECVSLLNTDSTQFVSKIDGYCFVFQNSDNQFNAFYNITESIVGFNSIIDDEEKIQGSSLDTDEQIKKGLVAVNGKLTKSGLFVTNSSDKKIELRGVGLHHLLQYKNLHNWQLFNTLKNYGVNLIRISTYLHDRTFAKSDGELAKGYLSSKDETIAEIEKIIKICVDLGMYCIIDWHNLDDNIMAYKDDAIEFFDYFSKKYADIPNILYEVCNEPYNDSASTVAAYVDELRKTILANTTNPIIITGVGKVENVDDTMFHRSLALKNELSAIGITDVFISPHFYGYYFGGILESCLQNDIPLFISEWGNSDSSGDGQYHDQVITRSIAKIHENCIPNSVWKLTDQAMTSSLLSNHGFINSYRYQYGFTFEDLSRNGMMILGLFHQLATNMYIERT